MGNKTKIETRHLVSDYLKLPLRDLAEVVAKMEIRRAAEEELQERLSANMGAKQENEPDGEPAETDPPEKLAVHCRSGHHAR